MTDQGVRVVMYWPNHSHIPMSVQPTDPRAFGDNTASESPPQSCFTDTSSYTHASNVPSMRVPPQNQPPPSSSFIHAGEDAHAHAAFESPPQPSFVNTSSYAHASGVTYTCVPPQNHPPGLSSFVHAGDETHTHAAFENSPQSYFADMSSSYVPADSSAQSDIHPQAPAAFENSLLQRSESWPSVAGRRREMARLRRFISKKQQGEMDNSLDISPADNSSAVGAGYYSENVITSEKPCNVYCDNGFLKSMDLSQTERESYGEKDSTSPMSSVSSIPSEFLDENEMYGRSADIALLAHRKGHESYDLTGEKPYMCSVDKSCVQLSHDDLPVEKLALPVNSDYQSLRHTGEKPSCVDGSSAIDVETDNDSVHTAEKSNTVKLGLALPSHPVSDPASDLEPGFIGDQEAPASLNPSRVRSMSSADGSLTDDDDGLIHTGEKPSGAVFGFVNTEGSPIHTGEKPSSGIVFGLADTGDNLADSGEKPSTGDTSSIVNSVDSLVHAEETPDSEPRFLEIRETSNSFASWRNEMVSYLSAVGDFKLLLDPDCIWYGQDGKTTPGINSLALNALIGQVEYRCRLHGVISMSKPKNSTDLWNQIYRLHMP